MLGLARFGRDALGQLRPRVDQVDRVEGSPAVVALVATRPVVAAVRAGALDVAVRKEALGDRVVELLGDLRADVASGVQLPEQLPGHLTVVVGHRGGEVVERDPVPVPLLADERVVAVHDVARRHPLLLGLDRDRRAVGVAARHHQHAVAGDAVVAGEDVGGQVGPGEVADVLHAVRVRPGDGDEDVAGGGAHACGRYQRAPTGLRPRPDGRDRYPFVRVSEEDLTREDTSGAVPLSSGGAKVASSAEEDTDT